MNEQRPLNSTTFIMIIGAVLLFLSLWVNVWTIQQAPEQQAFFNIWAKGNKNYVVWQPLEIEKAMYHAHDYNITWLSSYFFKKTYAVLGAYTPIFEMFALRLYGLVSVSFFVVVIALFGAIEGYIAYQDKKIQLGNISVTRLKVFMFLAVFAFALVFIFITLPFGSELPIIGKIPLVITWNNFDIWTSEPLIWRWFFQIVTFPIIHQIVANLARNI